MRRPTSVRLSEDEIELLAAHAHYLSERTGIPHSRSDVVRYLLKRATPEDNKGHSLSQARLKRAYVNIFGDGR